VTVQDAREGAQWGGSLVGVSKSQEDVMATGALSACGRSSQAAYTTLRSISKKLLGRGVEPPLYPPLKTLKLLIL
jgi:hypothetical protein